MGNLTGKITEIEDVSKDVHVKNEITVRTASGIVFIECRGILKNLSDGFNVGDEVSVEYRYDGKKSKTSKTKHNNLPATNIKVIKEAVSC